MVIPEDGSAAIIDLKIPLEAGTELIAVASKDGKTSDISNKILVTDTMAPEDGNADSDSDADTEENNHTVLSKKSEEDGRSTDTGKTQSHKAKGLPDTGETTTQNVTLFGTLFASLGGLFLFGKHRRIKNEEG